MTQQPQGGPSLQLGPCPSDQEAESRQEVWLGPKTYKAHPYLVAHFCLGSFTSKKDLRPSKTEPPIGVRV